MSDDFSQKWERVLNKFDMNFIEGSQSKSDEELNQQIMRSQNHISDLEHDMEHDAALDAAKKNVKELSGIYREGIKIEEARSRYCVWLLKSRGKDPGNGS